MCDAMTADAAANVIQERWREHAVALRVRRVRLLHERMARAEAHREKIAAEKRAAAEASRTLAGVMPRVWVIVREVLLVMCASVVLVLALPPTFDASLPEAFLVRRTDSPLKQAQAAVVGAALAVLAFTMFFLTLALLYVRRWERTLYALHSAWIALLLGGPLWLLLSRAHVAAGLAVDAPTLIVTVCNLTAPGVILVHWSATARRFAVARQLYADAIAVGCAWALCAIPWPTAVSALLMLAVLDIVLVSLPGAPVQRLDEIQTGRKLLGEDQMPGLTFKSGGLELGFGDFLVYAAFAAHAARAGASPFAAVMSAVAVGLIITMGRIALARVRTVLPALPLAVAMASSLLAVERLASQPVADALVRAAVSI